MTPEPKLDLTAYFARIGYSGPLEPTLDVLTAMHAAHYYNVPFENLDIRASVPIRVHGGVNFEKIVRQKRGGFCLELNGLFARALRQVGFKVDVLGARVMSEGRLGPALTHMTLLVHFDEPYLADVGFGGQVAGPLRLLDEGPQVVEGRKYVRAHDGDHWFLNLWELDGRQSTYVFTLQPRDFREFDTACHWLQTSPDSRFTQTRVVSLAQPDGRLTFSDGRLIRTLGETRDERELAGADEEAAVLQEEFGITLP